MAQRGELVLSGRLVPSERRQDDDDSRRRKRRRLAFYDDNEEKRMKGERKRMRELLSLLVTPVSYSIFDDWSRGRFFRRKTTPQPAPSVGSQA